MGLKVQLSPAKAGLTLKQALAEARITGVLSVPDHALCLHVLGGEIEQEAKQHGRYK